MSVEAHPATAYFSHQTRRLLGVMARVAAWRPEEFWTATPAEAAAVLGGWIEDGDDWVDGAMLGDLMEQFPDG